MTTLSKEDVVRMVRECGLNTEHDIITVFERFTALARADLVAENEQLKKQLRQQAEAIASTINKHHTALAAAEAREAKFIAALDQAESALGEIRDFPLTYLEVSEALSQPRDDSSLREMIAGVYEECAKELIRLDYLCAANVIRALAEKAKA